MKTYRKSKKRYSKRKKVFRKRSYKRTRTFNHKVRKVLGKLSETKFSAATLSTAVNTGQANNADITPVIAVGATNQTRIGSKVNMLGAWVTYRLFLRDGPAAGDPGNVVFQECRITCYSPRAASNSLPAASLYDETFATAELSMLAAVQRRNARFYYDKVVRLNWWKNTNPSNYMTEYSTKFFIPYRRIVEWDGVNIVRPINYCYINLAVPSYNDINSRFEFVASIKWWFKDI